MKFGEILSELRKDKGLLQKDLAKLLNVTVGTISNYETGTHMPDLESLVQLADFFGVSTDYLLGRTGFHCDIALLNSEYYNHVSLYETLNIMTGFEDKDRQYLMESINLLLNRAWAQKHVSKKKKRK